MSHISLSGFLWMVHRSNRAKLRGRTLYRANTACYLKHQLLENRTIMLPVFPNGGRSGYRDGVERMIIDELIPLIDKSYPTRADRDSRALVGFSMGGAGSVRLAINYPELFCAAGSMGGGLGFGPNARELEEALLDDFDRKASFMASKGLAMLLVNGDQDRPEAYDPLIPMLKQSGLICRVMILPDTKHNLGHYYQRSGDVVLKLLNDSLFGN